MTRLELPEHDLVGLRAANPGPFTLSGTNTWIVGERRSEIGLRKAIGATGRAIFVQFLAESTAVCLASGLLGAALGIALAQLVAHLAPASPFASTPVLDVKTVVTLTSALVLVGIVAGVAPAWRAAQVPPAEALRGV